MLQTLFRRLRGRGTWMSETEIARSELTEEEHGKILFILSALLSKLEAEAIFLINRNGQEIASSGRSGDYDGRSLASLGAASVAATHGLARLLGEREFCSVTHRGERKSLHIAALADEAVLLIVTDVDAGHVEESTLRRAGMILADILEKSRR